MESVNLSPLVLFTQAGIVGKSVIIILGLASLLCWVQIVEGCISLVRLGGAIAATRKGRASRLFGAIVEAGKSELAHRFDGESVGEVRARVIEAMNRTARSLISRLEGGLPNLAVVASVSPFVGLLGTVWGIMASFSAIADSNDTSLAVVAPGIAEALATTAIGLIAAIPASIAYSRLGASFAAKAQDVAALIEEQSLALMRRETSEGDK